MSTLKINGQIVVEGSKREVEAAVKRHYQTMSPNTVTRFQKVPGTMFMQDGRNSRVETDDWGNSLVIEH